MGLKGSCLPKGPALPGFAWKTNPAALSDVVPTIAVGASIVDRGCCPGFSICRWTQCLTRNPWLSSAEEAVRSGGGGWSSPYWPHPIAAPHLEPAHLLVPPSPSSAPLPPPLPPPRINGTSAGAGVLVGTSALALVALGQRKRVASAQGQLADCGHAHRSRGSTGARSNGGGSSAQTCVASPALPFA